MLKQAHESLEMMSALASAVKDERWGDAERVLSELKISLDVLTNGINEKVRGDISAPSPETRDRA
jgi:hypothetical protein